MLFIWAVTCILVIFFAQSFLFRLFNLRRLDYARFFNKRTAFVGDKVEMVEVISNDKFLPIPWVRMESHFSPYLKFNSQENLDISNDQYHRSIFTLLPFKKITRRHTITCTHRGLYNLHSVTMTTGDLLGMRQLVRTFSVDATIMVYPKIYSIWELPTPSREFQGDVTVRRWILPDPFLFSGIRDYTPGDSMRDIHWGATARWGKLQVTTRDFTTSPKILVLFNVLPRENLWGVLSPWEQEQMEAGVDYAASVANWAISNGVQVGFGTNALINGEDTYVRVQERNSEEHLFHIFDCLARLQMQRKMAFHNILDLEITQGVTGLDIIIITAFQSQAIHQRTAQLTAMGNSITYVPIALRAKEENASVQEVSA